MECVPFVSFPLPSQKEKDGSLFRCWTLVASAQIWVGTLESGASTTELARSYLSRPVAPVGESVCRPVELVRVMARAQHLALF